MNWEYEIEKHTTVEYIVTARDPGTAIRSPVAKCNSEAIARTIKGLYEDAEKEDAKNA